MNLKQILKKENIESIKVIDKSKGQDHKIFLTYSKKKNLVIRIPHKDNNKIFLQTFAFKKYIEKGVSVPKIYKIRKNYLLEELIEGKDMEELTISSENKKKIMTLDANEFIHRFLLHVLPKGFMRIRHYGLLSSRNINTLIPQCRKVLGVDDPKTKSKETGQESLLRITGIDITKCTVCNSGRYILVQEIQPYYIRGP